MRSGRLCLHTARIGIPADPTGRRTTIKGTNPSLPARTGPPVLEAAAADTKSALRDGEAELRAAPRSEAPAYVVRVIVEGRVAGSTTTDPRGKIPARSGPADLPTSVFSLELLDPDGRVVESTPLVDADLVSPPVVSFSGEGGSLVRAAESAWYPDDSFDADGDVPLCVTSSCQQVTLSWTAPNGSKPFFRNLRWRDGGRGVAAHGTLHAFAKDCKTYSSARVAPRGPQGEVCSDLTVEVRRYPTLSLVVVFEGDGLGGRGARWNSSMDKLVRRPRGSPRQRDDLGRGDGAPDRDPDTGRLELGDHEGKARKQRWAASR